MCRSNTLPLRALAGALALSFSLSCGSLGEREARLYQSGLEARRAERWEDAIRLLSRVLEQSPSDRDSLLNRGVSRYHVRDLSGAESDLKAAVGQIGDREALHEALYFLARSRIDRIRLLLTDPDRNSWAIQKETSTVLNDALLNLKEASRIRQTYETHLWSGYCYSSLQSYDAALRETEQCERINPDRLEHDMVQAMVYERASGGARIPKRSSRIYFDLLRLDAARNLHVLYEHLSVIFKRIAEADQDRVLTHLEAYVSLHADRNPGVAKMVERSLVRRKNIRLRDLIKQTLDTAKSLESSGDYGQALRLLEENEAFLPDSEELTALLGRLREGWSSQLEAEARTELEQPRPQRPELSIRKLRRALELTENPLRRAAIHQVIDTYRAAFLRLPGDKQFVMAQALIRNGEYQKALAVLAPIPRRNASTRHSLNYLLGYTHLQLNNWREAVVFLEKLPGGRFLNQQLYLGVALWKSGSRQNGLELLNDIPLQARSGDALRIIANRAREIGDLDEAVLNLEALMNPTREDLLVLRETLMNRGEQLSSQGDWNGALEEWRHARRVTESKLSQRDPGVYLLIGSAYFHVEDYARARKVIQDLLSYSLSKEEEIRYREAYMYRGLLHFSAEDDAKAFTDLKMFRSLGGEFPPDLRKTYDVLLGLRGDFVPLSRISSWEYSTGDGSPPTRVQIVDDLEDGKYLVEVSLGNQTALETWWLDGPFWHRQGESRRETIPSRLHSRDAELTSYEESFSNGTYTAKIVATGVLVVISDTKSYPGCLKVELRRETRRSPPLPSRIQESTLYLAPDVGVVKREIFEDGVKTAVQILTRIVERDQ